jgi:hypothetical protein
MPGPVRDGLAEQAAARAEAAGAAVAAGVDDYVERVRGVVLARVRSRKARQGTRHWVPKSGEKSGRPEGIELKAMDGEYVAPDSLTGEIVEAMRPVVFGVTRDAAADTASRLGGDDAAEGMFAVDRDLLDDLVDEALEDLLGGAERWAADIRDTIVAGERDSLDLDDLLDNVGEALDRGGNWLRLRSRDIGTALAAKSSLEQARALGVTHTQWISRRDERVRGTHVIADGQVRPIGEPFRVGAHLLEYPGDPSGLPESAGEVYGCRCGLLFADRDTEFLDALDEIMESAQHPDAATPSVAELLDTAARSRDFVDGPELDDLPGIASLVELPDDVVGWRVLDLPLDADPGQRIELPAGTTLGLASPRELDARALAILVPARTAVGISGGTLTLAEPVTLEVLAAGDAGVQARMVAAP